MRSEMGGLIAMFYSGSGAGIPTIVLQGVEWNMSPNQVNFAGNLNVIMLGIGGLIWIPFCYFWGRAPILFWTTLAGTFFTLACALAPNFATFYGFRALMGVTVSHLINIIKSPK